MRLSERRRWSAVLARHAERGDDDVEQHDDVDEVGDDVLPRRHAHKQRRVSMTVSQLGQLRVATVAHLRQFPIGLGVVAQAQCYDEVATCLLQLLGGRRRAVAALAAALSGALQRVDASARACYPEVDVGNTDGRLRGAAGTERRQRDGPRRRGGVLPQQPTAAASRRRRCLVVVVDLVKATSRGHG